MTQFFVQSTTVFSESVEISNGDPLDNHVIHLLQVINATLEKYWENFEPIPSIRNNLESFTPSIRVRSSSMSILNCETPPKDLPGKTSCNSWRKIQCSRWSRTYWHCWFESGRAPEG